MALITFERFKRDCPANKNLRNPLTGHTRLPIYDWNVMIDGEHRATAKRIYTGRGYEIYDADDRAIAGRNGIGQKVDSQANFEGVVAQLLRAGMIPTLAEMAEMRAAEQTKREHVAAEEAEANRVWQIKGAGVDLYDALRYIAEHSGEKTIRAKAEAAIAKAEGRDESAAA